MSHTTTIKSLAIRDTRAIVSAVNELAENGVVCHLEEDAVARLFYQNQHQKCAYVVKLPNCRFDLGLDLQQDGTYAPVFDEFGGHVAKFLGAKGKNTRKNAQDHIGQFVQAYAKHAAINAAVENGYVVTDVTVDDRYNVHISVETGY